MIWQELKRFSKPQRCKIFIREFLEAKSFDIVAKRYYVNPKTVIKLIESNRFNPLNDLEVQDLYKKMDEVKAENLKTRKKKGFKDEDNEIDEFRILDAVPKKISYLAFLDIVAEVLHSKASTNDWLHAAETKGIKVII